MENKEMTPEEKSKEAEREEKIQRFLKKTLKFLKEQKCLIINRHISEDYVMIEYR